MMIPTMPVELTRTEVAALANAAQMMADLRSEAHLGTAALKSAERKLKNALFRFPSLAPFGDQLRMID